MSQRRTAYRTRKRVQHLNWTGCYDRGWGKELVPAAFAHPAKVSRLLSKRIYDFMFERGWLKEHDVVLDPFGGIAGFGLEAMLHGCNFVGVELEPRFVALAQENINLWNKRYQGKMPHWGSAQIIQGDSRHLLDVIAGAGSVVSSPPYSESHIASIDTKRIGDNPEIRVWKQTSGDNYSRTTPGQLAALREGNVQAAISSPPYVKNPFSGSPDMSKTPSRKPQWNNAKVQARLNDHALGYGDTEGQLSAMPEGIISSPPYAAARVGDECGQEHVGHNGNYGKSDGQLGSMPTGIISRPPFAGTLHGQDDKRTPSEREAVAGVRLHNRGGEIANARDYGTSAGQLGAMAEGVISSPPYEGSMNSGRNGIDESKFKSPRGAMGANRQANIELKYGHSDGQVGAEQGETFWSASRLILEQAYAALAPGAHVAWVLKAFVRNKAIVDFPGQWQSLAESVGFQTAAIVKAWQTKDDGTQRAFDGNHKRLTTERKGFFRRLHEKKYPTTKIDYEIVLFQVKP